ncbi:NADPH:quinone reductase-like Zn-dependent oxidoreductase [Kribbella steppae]|uniref:NADPH:quinone reductase-like Zn-dependent oxidoreductase n=1 Tax=Kribbella steppae TaxID=2512223 RepID=A0A4R2HLX6_9ACTN|nr:NAD(P)-dependent alcohol dehydrogenase [Kribbella steppae]TCO30214.1 NADPH:quinone reductase-like Zn-dependent oxidoreductase [Kribbella steppae]
MKAVVQGRYGGPEALEVKEIDQPGVVGNEVLVRVRAASLNARDWHVMRGDPYVARLMDPATFGLRAPKMDLGTDFAGVVEAVGPDVRRLKPGDEVYGEAGGAFAEYVKAPDTVVDTKPANLTFEQAAAMPLAANTALMGLRDVAQLKAGQQLLINGASGGVGTFAVQIAKALDAEVTAVCSTKNVDLMRSLGADAVVDYTQDDFTSKQYDVVLDLVGNRSLADLRRALTPTGLLILSGGGVFRGGSVFGPVGLMIRGMLLSRFVSQRIVTFDAKPSAENLATLRTMAEDRKLIPAIDRTYPLAEIAEAIRYVETEHARAKVVITA